MLNWIKKIATSSQREGKQQEINKEIANRQNREQESQQYKKEGNALLAEGKFDAAADCYRKALQVDPAFTDAYLNLAFVLIEQEQFEEAKNILQKALALNSELSDAWYMLGTIATKENNADIAISNLLKTVQIQPTFEYAYLMLNDVFLAQDQPAKARAILLQGIVCNPDGTDLMARLGTLYASGMEAERAIGELLKNSQASPDYVLLHARWGKAYQDSGRLEAACASYERALSLKPDMAAVHFNLGNALKDLGNLQEAKICYQKALALMPEDVDAHNNLGNAYMLLGEYKPAIEHYRAVVSLKPDFFLGFSNLGLTLEKNGQLEEAVECFRRALAINPNFIDCYSYLLFALSFHEKCLPAEYLDEARRFGSKVFTLAQPYAAWPVVEAATRGEQVKKLRIGLVSGDFRDHAVSYFLEGVFPHLDRTRIELIAYSTHPEEDALTARIKDYFVEWHPIYELSDEVAAKKIHQSNIHVLIDLAGHTRYNRLPLFAWKPAPVQVTWLGFLASTGVPGMDYLLADPVTAPACNQADFTETIWHMPHTVNCYTPPVASAKLAISPLPAESNGCITFGCFQNLHKINDTVISIWGQIFQALPQARLHIQNKLLQSESIRADLMNRLEKAGILASQVKLIGPIADREDYLALHNDVDIMLDTFPYPGITTTCEALWMGVPSISLAGKTLLSRQGASLLSCVGLADWVAASESEYVDKALQHAADRARLVMLRASLRAQALASPLFDAPRFAKDLEEALRGMWHAKISKQYQ